MEYRIFQIEAEINCNLKFDWTVEKIAEKFELIGLILFFLNLA